MSIYRFATWQWNEKKLFHTFFFICKHLVKLFPIPHESIVQNSLIREHFFFFLHIWRQSIESDVCTGSPAATSNTDRLNGWHLRSKGKDSVRTPTDKVTQSSAYGDKINSKSCLPTGSFHRGYVSSCRLLQGKLDRIEKRNNRPGFAEMQSFP